MKENKHRMQFQKKVSGNWL